MPREVVGACPLDCPDACSWVITVDDDGHARKIRGNPAHPHTRGALCVKVNPILDFLGDPSRLLHPMKRIGPKGQGRFERITWDEALQTMASRLREILDTDGGDAIWPYDGCGTVGFMQGVAARHRFWNAIGAAGHLPSICSISGHVGLSYTSGTAAGMDPEDVVHARTILIWGSNTLTSNQHFWPFVEQARANGAHVVVVDPIRHRTAARADEHVALRAGTDVAFALGLCHVIAASGGTDESFLRTRTLGADEFLDSLADYKPEVVADTCGVPVEQIVGLGRRIAAGGPTAIKVGQGAQRQQAAGQTLRAISCIPALTGDYVRAGGGLVYSTGDAYRYNTVKYSRPDLRPGKRRTLIMTRIGRELSRTDPPVRALFVTAANPVVSNPDQRAVRAGLSREDLFTVVFDAYMTDTAAYADLVLPSTLQPEQNELMDSYGHLYANWNEPAVAPPGEAISRTELMRRLAAAMNLSEPALFASDHELAADLLDSEPWTSAGVTFADLRAAGFLRIPGTESYRPFAARFPTGSGLFEFASARAANDGHGRVPHYTPPPESGTGRAGAFDLITPAGHHYVNSTFAGIARNVARSGEPTVTVCADDAVANGLVEGALVRVANERGAFVARLAVGPAARPGVAVAPKGAWTAQFVDGWSVNATTREADSDMGCGAVYHDNRVTITPT
jgi:anaerobic selenocysteine-containing dehydrogenase